MNASGFETWRALHATYDRGQQAKKLQALHRIMNPTWNNATQQPNGFVRQFNQWTDEIFNYEGPPILSSTMRSRPLCFSTNNKEKYDLIDYSITT
eukprot:6463683-Amphidinium_carterae.1